MSIDEARQRLAMIDAALARLDDDLTVASIDISSHLAKNQPTVFILPPEWESFDERIRSNLQYVRYRRDIDGVAFIWHADEPLPEGV